MPEHIAYVVVPHHCKRPLGTRGSTTILDMGAQPHRQQLVGIDIDTIALRHRPRIIDGFRKRLAELLISDQPLHESLDMRERSHFFRRTSLENTAIVTRGRGRHDGAPCCHQMSTMTAATTASAATA